MNATSGIPIASDVQHAFAAAAHSTEHRFLKLAIRNESIVLDATAPVRGDLDADLDALQDLLEVDVPAYVLARLDDPSSQWLAITYVPEAATVREKMLYASTRNNLTRSLGAAAFPDALFATHKSDLTAQAYAAHRRHQSAPQPRTRAEQELADVKAAERVAGRFEGPTARKNHLGGAGVQFKWGEDTEAVVRGLVDGETGSRLLVLTIDAATETLVLTSDEERTPNEIGDALPPSNPSYAFFVWSPAQRRDTVFIYSCPSASPIKHRMLYSSGVASVLAAAKDLGITVAKKIETSDPREVNESFLRAELGHIGSGTEEKRPFAKPSRPARKQR